MGYSKKEMKQFFLEARSKPSPKLIPIGIGDGMGLYALNCVVCFEGGKRHNDSGPAVTMFGYTRTDDGIKDVKEMSSYYYLKGRMLKETEFLYRMIKAKEIRNAKNAKDAKGEDDTARKN